MLFYLSQTFGKSVEMGNQDSIDCLTRLLDSRKRGLLLIYSSAATKEKLVGHLKSRGDTHNAQLLDAISRKFREKKQLLKELRTFVIIKGSLKGEARRRGRLIVTDPKFINNSNLLYPPIFLGENLNDCDLYVKKIASNFTANLPTAMAGIQVFERFEPGGGNSTHMSYRRHKNQELDFCLCVVDSDRHNPSSGLGDTAKFVADVDKPGKSVLCDHYVIDTYSAENLLPLGELDRQFKIGKSADQIETFNATKDLRPTPSWIHLPLKKGIRGKDLKKPAAYSIYWGEQLSKIGKNIPCCEVEECDCILIPSISDKTLANALSPDAPKWEESLNKENNSQLRAQYADLSALIKSWLCIGKPIRS